MNPQSCDNCAELLKPLSKFVRRPPYVLWPEAEFAVYFAAKARQRQHASHDDHTLWQTIVLPENVKESEFYNRRRQENVVSLGKRRRGLEAEYQLLQEKMNDLEALHKTTMKWLSASQAECTTLRQTVKTLEYETEIMRREICAATIEHMIVTIENA